ncbi:MAG: SagB/ThcOx family dehydrogenase [PVC group bacterium]
MKKSSFTFSILLSAVVLLLSPLLPAGGDLKPIQLLKPRMEGGKPLLEALKERRSSREFSNQKLPGQLLADLLWAAFGVNRPEAGKRTAPSAVNWQEIDIYVALEEGLFLYDALANMLKPVLGEDIRALTGNQDFTQDAPVNLIYVADLSRMGKADRERQDFYSAADTGFISQNVYLFCASEGLVTVVLGHVDKPALEKKMGLRPDQKVILTQPVGYPEK